MPTTTFTEAFFSSRSREAANAVVRERRICLPIFERIARPALLVVAVKEEELWPTKSWTAALGWPTPNGVRPWGFNRDWRWEEGGGAFSCIKMVSAISFVSLLVLDERRAAREGWSLMALVCSLLDRVGQRPCGGGHLFYCVQGASYETRSRRTMVAKTTCVARWCVEPHVPAEDKMPS